MLSEIYTGPNADLVVMRGGGRRAAEILDAGFALIAPGQSRNSTDCFWSVFRRYHSRFTIYGPGSDSLATPPLFRYISSPRSPR